jgi:hypothetical protein
VDTNIIVVITYGHITQGVLELLYDVGVRRGDKTLIGIEWIAIEVTSDPPEELAAKRRELIYGCIQFFPAEWTGEFGKRAQSLYADDHKVYPDSFASYYYDAFLAIAYTFDWMVKTGKDYEVSSVFRANFFE